MPAKESASSGGERKLPVDDREPTAPDGGWGWVILLASFLTSLIVDGVCFAFGIFLLEFLDYFGESKGKTAWIGSVLNGTYMVMGPLAGALANRFGCRAVAIAGSLWSAIAFWLSTLSPNVNMLIFTYGILGGIGFGLMYLPSIVIVGYYFDKKRAFATGIATCGSGIGAFIMAPLCKFLIDQYGWQGAQWIVSAIVLNGIVLGALYRPLTFKDMEKMRRKWRRKQMQKLENVITNDTSDTTESEDTEETGATDAADNYRIQIDAAPKPLLPRKTSGLDPVIVDNEKNGTVHDKWAEMQRRARAEALRNGNVRRRTVSNRSDDGGGERGGGLGHYGDSWHSLSGFASSMENLPSHLDRNANTADPEPPSGELHQQRLQGRDLCALPREIAASVAQTMDFSMLRNPVFVLYSFSCILCMAGFFIPFIYLPHNAIRLGYSSDRGAFLLSLLGISNTLGRVIAGWVSDRSWADCLLINNMALILGGTATIFCPFFTNYASLVVYACVFGLCIAAFVSLRSIILVDLIGLNKLTSAFGIIVLCQGLTSFVGAPIAGSLYDLTGTYDLSFYVAGTTIALAGLICLPLRRIACWYTRRKGHLKMKNTKDAKVKDTRGKDTKTKNAKSKDAKSTGKTERNGKGPVHKCPEKGKLVPNDHTSSV